jgi:hypothetical protein
MKSIPYPSSGPSGRGQVASRISSGAVPEGADQYIGKRVKTRWPDDNHFYEAVITDYNPIEVCMLIDLGFFFFKWLCSSRITIVRGGMLWYMIWEQQMRHGNGLICQRYMYCFVNQLFYFNFFLVLFLVWIVLLNCNLAL